MRRILIASAASLLLLCSTAWSAPNDPGFSLQWGMAKIGAESAWQRARGAGVTIAVIDSGVDLDHEDLTGRFVAGRDYIDNDNDPRDENGHGTHVAGIAAASSGNGKGVAGVAPASKIMSVRVLGPSGLNVSLSPQLLASSAAAVDYAWQNGAKVINLSLGGVATQGPGASLAAAIQRAWNAGAICVVAAGNNEDPNGDPTSGYSNENAIVVVSTDGSDRKSGFSNTAGNAKWAISAPGSSVYSTWFTPAIGDHAEYEYSSGTSMAAPHVSGAAAILFSMGLNNEGVVQALIGTAKDLGPAGRDSTFGAGRLDLAAAVASVSSPGSGQSGPGPSQRPGTVKPSQGQGSPSPGTSPIAGSTSEITPGPSSEPGQPGGPQAGGPSGPGATKTPRWMLASAVMGLAIAAAGLFGWFRRAGSG